MSTFDQASLVMIPSGYKTSKLYSIKPTDGSGDLVVSRSNDTATRVGPDGLIEKVRTNLSLYSEQFDNASWSKGTLTVTANAGTAPNGTTTADLIYPSANSSNSVIFNGITIANSTEYTNSIYVKASGKTWTFMRGINDGVGVWFDVANGVIGTTQSGVSGTITSVGSGWYRCSVTQTSSSTTGRLVVLVVDGDGSTAVTASGTNGLLIWGAQTETGVATDYIATTSAAVSVGPVANVPRLDYLNSSCPRLLLEPQRSNLVTFSEQFDNAAWVGGNVTVTANNVTSPDGYTNADTFTEDASTAQHGRASALISFVSGTTYTFSAFAKNAPSGRGFVQLYGYQLGSGTANVFANFDLNTGVVGTATGGTSTITNYGNGWYRCTFTFVCGTTQAERINLVNVTSASATAGQSYAGDITKSIYWWGAQVEVGAYATSYIPTLGAAVTRGADAASKTGISSLIGQTEGTLFVEMQRLNTGVGSGVVPIQLNDGTNNNRAQIEISSTGAALCIVSSGGSLVANITGPTLTIGQTAKIAISYKVNDFKIFVNGVLAGTDTSGAVPVSMSRVDLASEVGVSYSGFALSQALHFKTALTSTQLAELTA